MSRKRRLADFASRARETPEALRQLDGLGRYWAVHPMADEAEDLRRLGVTPKDCTDVDVYWEYAGDVMLVQVQAKSEASPRGVGVYARRRPYGGGVNLVVVVDDAEVTSALVARALVLLSTIRLEEDRLTEQLECQEISSFE